ncbi:fas-binding factor 1 isoform X2 [Tachyglossus aculeatus]|uniref:fas-binding factor 1 isoform X2 n=1 Tax=Tachyglossus aculeatus TaxID=9261 RepID=UPI0018F4DA78|nr:fas-binding factor 1 isoform X2 [Tachyglossus aculeatus]
MAPKAKRGLRGSIDDVLGDLLGEDDPAPAHPGLGQGHARPAREPPPRAGRRSFLDGDVFGPVAAQVDEEAEVSEVSDADPQALLQSMKDMDEMDADLLGRRRSSPVAKAIAKGSGKEESLDDPPRAAGTLAAGEASRNQKPRPSIGGSGRQSRKFSFEDAADPLAGLLSEDEEEEAASKKPPGPESKAAPQQSPNTPREREPAAPGPASGPPAPKKEELAYDDSDDLMAALGFGDSPKAGREPSRGNQEEPRPARTKLDELLGRSPAPRLPERPAAGERPRGRLEGERPKQPEREDAQAEEDLIFGAYQPTLVSSEGRPPRRPSVRFSAERLSEHKRAKPGSPAATAVTATPVSAQPGKRGADWLGLKDHDLDSPLPSPPMEPRGVTAPNPPTLPGAERPVEGGSAPKEPSEEGQEEPEDWLSQALMRRGRARKGQAGPVVLQAPSSQPGTGSEGLEPRVAQGAPGTCRDARPAGTTSFGAPCAGQVPAASLSSEGLHVGSPRVEPPAGSPWPREQSGFASAQPLLPEPRGQSLLPGSREDQRQIPLVNLTESPAEPLRAQARLAELEAQVRKLELERTQQGLLLETLQQRHQEDLELIENAHRSRVKVLEMSFEQREKRLRLENEELASRQQARCQEAERALAELQAQHQLRLAAVKQEKDRELERLRDLQRASVLEMRQDHEEQLQRLKQLKDREIDAVTSATSHTRSLNSIIEQMEKFSCHLSDLSSRVEAAHVTTTQERELGARQRDEQLRALQDRLSQQQRDTEEERGRLHGAIAKMEARLGEQGRLLEQERWRVSAEQCKAEASQRALEEQRKVVSQQAAMEREELERAKSALLEEQKSVLLKCGEERRRLAAEWAEFYAQQKLQKERAEREVERTLQADAQREGTVLHLAKEQAELKARAGELRAGEQRLAEEREALEQERRLLSEEKGRVSAAAGRLRQRAAEVDSMSEVAARKFEEGERALQEARQVRAQHQARLQLVQQQQEQLRQQEEQMHHEHLNLAQHRWQLDAPRDDLHHNLPRGPLGLASLHASPVGGSGGSSSLPPGSQPSSGISQLHARLVLLKHSAQRDRDFLEDEQFFLETLRRPSSHPA